MNGAFNPDDWITIWQSEMAARAVDRESHEFITRYAQSWIGLARDAARPAPGGDDGPAGRAGPDAADGPAPLGLAPDAVRDGLEQLRRQLEAIQRGPAGSA